ncbi:MAG: HAMP domain-containing sensor histidine kinase [Eubacteriales bacterium]|nr:HAMP domain-containing sensor histidine kinase [Eubacteriales bacterium]
MVLGIFCVILLLGNLALLGKIFLLRRDADEIRMEFTERLSQDTNTLITLSSHDRAMRRLADALNEELRRLRQERQRYQTGNQALSDAVTNISHDLRTPLTAICGYLDLLKREETSETVSRYLDMIENRSEVLKLLTEELFRSSVMVTEAEELVLEPIALNAVLEETVGAYYGAFKKCGITPEISMPEANVFCLLDRKALSRILGNILANVLKYSSGDLTIRLSANGKITFSNTAKDLNPVATERLFDRYFTVETGRSSTGLGLSIAKALTERMGGTISAGYADGKLSITLVFEPLRT